MTPVENVLWSDIEQRYPNMWAFVQNVKKKALAGYNDLQTLNPDIAVEWNYDKNGNLKPTITGH